MSAKVELAIEAYERVEKRQLSLDRAKREHMIAAASLLHEERSEYWARTQQIEEKYEIKREQEGLS